MLLLLLGTPMITLLKWEFVIVWLLVMGSMIAYYVSLVIDSVRGKKRDEDE